MFRDAHIGCKSIKEKKGMIITKPEQWILPEWRDRIIIRKEATNKVGVLGCCKISIF